MKWSYIDPTFPLLVVSASLWVALKWRSLPRGRLFLALPLAALWFLSLPHGAWLLSLTLHEKAALPPVSTSEAQAIVALAGGVLPPSASLPTPLPLVDTVASAEKAAWTYLNWKRLPILLCGGTTAPSLESTPYSNVMRSILLQRGIAQTEIWTEDRSSSTAENALFGSTILKRKGIQKIVLITHYLHYRRAKLAFEHQGIIVEPAIIGDFAAPPANIMAIFPSVDALRQSQRVVHELGGLLAYRVTDKI